MMSAQYVGAAVPDTYNFIDSALVGVEVEGEAGVAAVYDQHFVLFPTIFPGSFSLLLPLTTNPSGRVTILTIFR